MREGRKRKKLKRERGNEEHAGSDDGHLVQKNHEIPVSEKMVPRAQAPRR